MSRWSVWASTAWIGALLGACTASHAASPKTTQTLPATSEEGTEPKPSLAGPKARNSERSGPRSRANREGRASMGNHPALGSPGKTGAGDAFLTDEQVNRLMTFVEHNFPPIYDRLARVRDRDPAVFQKMIHRTARVMLPMLRTAMDNPELGEKMVAEHKAQLSMQELKEKFARTQNSSERTRLREEIRTQMEVAFDARLDRLRIEVKQLQQRLDQARQNLTKQEKNKQKLIDARLADTLSEAPLSP